MICGKCGLCCRAIYLRCSPADIEKEVASSFSTPDHIFLHKYWREITIKEASVINLSLVKRTEKERLRFGDIHFYTCMQYDQKNKRCKSYNNRPLVCKNYPHYPQKGKKEFFTKDDTYGKECAFYGQYALVPYQKSYF